MPDPEIKTAGTAKVEPTKADGAKADGAKAGAGNEPDEKDRRISGLTQQIGQMTKHLGVKSPKDVLSRRWAEERDEEEEAGGEDDRPASTRREPKPPGEQPLKRPSPNDAKFSHDEYGALTPEGEAQFAAADDVYFEAMAAKFFDRREDASNERVFDESLETEMNALPAAWKDAPEKWPLEASPGDLLETVVSGMAGVLAKGRTPGPTHLRAAREQVTALLKHVATAVVADADKSADETAKKEPLQGGTGEAAGAQEQKPFEIGPGTTREQMDARLRAKRAGAT